MKECLNQKGPIELKAVLILSKNPKPIQVPLFIFRIERPIVFIGKSEVAPVMP